MSVLVLFKVFLEPGFAFLSGKNAWNNVGKELIDNLWIMTELSWALKDMFWFWTKNIQWIHPYFPTFLTALVRFKFRKKVYLNWINSTQSEHPVYLLLCRWHFDSGHLTSLFQPPSPLFPLAIGFWFSLKRILWGSSSMPGLCKQLSCIVVNPTFSPSLFSFLTQAIHLWLRGSADVQTEQQDVNVVLSVRMIATLFDVHLAFTYRRSAHLHFPPLPSLPLPSLLYILSINYCT